MRPRIHPGAAAPAPPLSERNLLIEALSGDELEALLYAGRPLEGLRIEALSAGELEALLHPGTGSCPRPLEPGGSLLIEALSGDELEALLR